MDGIFGLISKNEYKIKEFESSKKSFTEIYHNDYMEYKFTNCFFGYSNLYVDNSYSLKNTIKNGVLFLLNGKIYQPATHLSEIDYIHTIYINEGIQGLKKLTGQFVILIYDLTKRELLNVLIICPIKTAIIK